MKKNGFEDKRLLEAIDRINSKYISEMLEYYDDLPAEGTASKRLSGKRIRYVVSLAACIVLLATVIPVANYIATRVIGVTPGGNPGGNPSATSDILSNDTESESADLEWEHSPIEKPDDFDYPEPEGGLNFIEHVGEVPEEFKEIVENNLFDGVEVFGDVLIRTVLTEDENIFYFFDKAGNITFKAKYPYFVDEKRTYAWKKFIDSEGNLLVCFEDNSFNSGAKIVKFDTKGEVVFDIDLPNKTKHFGYNVETDDGYIFAGMIYEENGNYPRTLMPYDVLVVKLTHDGMIQHTLRIGTEGERDSVSAIEKTDKGAYLYLRLPKDTTVESEYYLYEISNDLTVLKQTAISKEDKPERDFRYTINGKKFDNLADFTNDPNRGINSPYFSNYVIEYDDFVLIVSGRFTSSYTCLRYYASSTIDVKSYYTETVYAGYTKDGELIWRTAVDSTSYAAIKDYYERTAVPY